MQRYTYKCYIFSNITSTQKFDQALLAVKHENTLKSNYRNVDKSLTCFLFYRQQILIKVLFIEVLASPKQEDKVSTFGTNKR